MEQGKQPAVEMARERDGPLFRYRAGCIKRPVDPSELVRDGAPPVGFIGRPQSSRAGLDTVVREHARERVLRVEVEKARAGGEPGHHEHGRASRPSGRVVQKGRVAVAHDDLGACRVRSAVCRVRSVACRVRSGVRRVWSVARRSRTGAR